MQRQRTRMTTDRLIAIRRMQHPDWYSQRQYGPSNPRALRNLPARAQRRRQLSYLRPMPSHFMTLPRRIFPLPTSGAIRFEG